MIPFKNIMFCIFSICLYSCTKDVDFNQINDASIKTSHIVTLVHLNIEARDFLNEFNEEIEFTGDVIDIPNINDSNGYLERIEFTLISENTFSRNFMFQFIFFDAYNNPIYTVQPVVNIPSNSSKLTTTLEIPMSDIGKIHQAEYVGFQLFMSPSADGSVISIEDPSILNLKSSMQLFLNLRKV